MLSPVNDTRRLQAITAQRLLFVQYHLAVTGACREMSNELPVKRVIRPVIDKSSAVLQFPVASQTRASEPLYLLRESLRNKRGIATARSKKQKRGQCESSCVPSMVKLAVWAGSGARGLSG